VPEEPREPVASDVVYEGALLSVVRETWTGLPHPYDVVRHPGAAAVLPITPEGQVLLVRQFRPAIRQELVEIPAGLLDVRGEDAITCAARELTEETGYRHREIEFLGGIYSSAGFANEYLHLFWASTEAEPVAEPEDGISLLREPFGEMVMAAKAGRIRDAKTALALLLAEARGVVRVG
jgi:ADP-ribose pyrophosphatase